MNSQKAIVILMGMIISVLVFHILVLTKMVPYEMAWGGQLGNNAAMYTFESISVMINLFLGWVLLMKGNYLPFRFSERVINGILWIFFALFVVNTVANLFARTDIEKAFSILTLSFAVLLWIILRGRHSPEDVP